jgi:hypothetical protein
MGEKKMEKRRPISALVHVAEAREWTKKKKRKQELQKSRTEARSKVSTRRTTLGPHDW